MVRRHRELWAAGREGVRARSWPAPAAVAAHWGARGRGPRLRSYDRKPWRVEQLPLAVRPVEGLVGWPIGRALGPVPCGRERGLASGGRSRAGYGGEVPPRSSVNPVELKHPADDMDTAGRPGHGPPVGYRHKPRPRPERDGRGWLHALPGSHAECSASSEGSSDWLAERCARSRCPLLHRFHVCHPYWNLANRLTPVRTSKVNVNNIVSGFIA
jgi:hypothetical protein